MVVVTILTVVAIFITAADAVVTAVPFVAVFVFVAVVDVFCY